MKERKERTVRIGNSDFGKGRFPFSVSSQVPSWKPSRKPGHRLACMDHMQVADRWKTSCKPVGLPRWVQNSGTILFCITFAHKSKTNKEIQFW